MGTAMLRRVIGWIIFLLSLITLVWGLRPATYVKQQLSFSPQELQFPLVDQSDIQADLQVKGVASYQLQLEFPHSLRLGDAGIIRLAFEAASSENSESPNPEPKTLSPSGTISDCQRVLQARLDLSGIRHTPTGEISQMLAIEHPVIFLWNLRPEKPGLFNGKVWLHLICVPEPGGADIGKVLAAQQVDIQVTSLFGLSGSLARTIGGVGFIIGLTLGLESWLFKLLKTQSERIRE